MGSESIAHKQKAAIDSEAMRGRGIMFQYLIQLVGQKYRDKITSAGKTRFSHHCFGFQSRCFLLLVGYNIQPSSSSTNQNAALIIYHQLDFTKMPKFKSTKTRLVEKNPKMRFLKLKKKKVTYKSIAKNFQIPTRINNKTNFEAFYQREKLS